MQTLEKANKKEILASFAIFQNLGEEVIDWFLSKAEYQEIAEGERPFEVGAPADWLLVMLDGKMVFKLVQNGTTKEVGMWETGDVTGLLPFSRMKEFGGFATALRKSKLLKLHKRYFTEMVNVSYELTQRLVAEMTDRVRNFTSRRTQDEKLMALGKLSAGLAHELNNPASAMVRSADELQQRMHITPERFKEVITMRITTEQTDAVNEIIFNKIKTAHEIDLSLMEREEQLDDLMDWMEDNDIRNADDTAETFVDYGISVDECDRIAEILEQDYLSPVFQWLENVLSNEKLVLEIRESADRIAELVRSVKAYSHMDRGRDMELTDIHDGIRSTIMMLKHKLKSKNIQLDKDFDNNIPQLKAYVSQLNQVWTNIIVNAIHAMDKGGKLTIKTFEERGNVCVQIADTGKGIPEDIITRIFEPFFTTKKMDEGTGIGLDIVKKILTRHKADISVESEPGNTTFSICFPQNCEL
ncbi:MAG: ATP-binding protein [Saprospiraceae bacterium]